METPGGADRRLTTDGADDENPTWSPAWTYIAFQSNRGGNWDIFTIRAGCDVATLGEEACGLRQLTDDPADDMLPAWSPRCVPSSRCAVKQDLSLLLSPRSTTACGVDNDPAGGWRPAGANSSTCSLNWRVAQCDLYAVRIPDKR
ncbi:MAG: PD40 domain-containing protein [Caldilineaceae bacterium]|nr:PD40 domain-containing protein [Caldilineaceae bacterium]